MVEREGDLEGRDRLSSAVSAELLCHQLQLQLEHNCISKEDNKL